MSWEKIQKEISDRYCGTVLVLDDEIYKRTSAGKKAQHPFVLNDSFSAVKEAFEKRGALCDLWHIEDQLGSTKNSKPILRALQRCDTVIVDWYLGRGKDQTKDSANAVSVLRELKTQSGFRFAAIHSNEDADTILNGLKYTFGDELFEFTTARPPSLEEDKDDEILTERQSPSSSSAEQSPSTYRIGKSLYVCILKKDSAPASAAELPDLFYNQLKSVFSDHLHWVGFEFAARTRELLPELLQSLPAGTDAALAFQSLLQGDNELSDCLIECLTVELRALIKQNGIQSASDDTIISKLATGVVANSTGIRKAFPKFTSEMKSKWKDVNCADVKEACIENGDRKFKEIFYDRFPTRLKDNDRSGLSAHKSELSEFVTYALGLSFDDATANIAHHNYAALREQTHSVTPDRIGPGVVLRRKKEKTEGDKWLVCISPACDCARGESKRQYLLVGGVELPKPTHTKSGTMQSCLRDREGVCYHIKWDSKKMQTRKMKPKQPDDYDFFGLMHSEFTNSLIHAVWGHETRVGVSTSDFVRKEREQ